MKTLLVTGFEPFGGAQVNPSWECAKAMPDELPGARVVKAQLPVAWARVNGKVNLLLDELRPDAALLLGQAGGRCAITIERIAMNLRESELADNLGEIARGEPVVPGAPDGLFSNLPCRAMLDALNAAGLPAAFSYSAGPYLCNDAMYVALHRARTDLPKMRAGFVHVPYMKGQSETAFSMELEDMIQGIRICLETLAGRLEG